MSDDSDSDDDILNFNIGPTALITRALCAPSNGQKRERKQVARLGEEALKDNGNDEFDLEVMMRASDKNNKRIKKVGHDSTAAAIDQVLNTTIDWSFIKEPTDLETRTARGRSGGGEEHNKDYDADVGNKYCSHHDLLYDSNNNIDNDNDEEEDDDDDDGEEVEEMGDLDGKIRNIQRGARSMLCRQSALWPTTKSLAFGMGQAKDGSGSRPLHDMLVKLEEFSSDTAESALALAEILSRTTNGIAELLEDASQSSTRVKDAPTVAKSTVQNISTIAPSCVPQELWNWLMDLVAFHPMDAVVAAASFTIKSILERLPEPPHSNVQEPLKNWEPLRPLTYASVCRPLTCLGLDPMADDPTAATPETTSAFARPGAGLDMPRPSIGLQSQMDFEAVVRPLFPGCNLGALLDVWACCVESGHHSLCGDEKLDLLCVCCVIGADALALGVPRLDFHRNRLAAALLRGLPAPVIWPREAMRRITALVCVAQDADLKMRIVRCVPLTHTGSRGNILVSAAVGYYAHEACISASDANYSSLPFSRSEFDTHKLATRLLEKFHSESCIRKHVRTMNIRWLYALIATIDLLLIAGSSRHEYSVAKLNWKIDEVRIWKCVWPLFA